jgi:hypothetical protein
VIWRYRNPNAVDFLGQSLDNADPNVWKQALDGLVTIGGADATRWIEKTEERVSRGQLNNGLTTEWLREALGQIGTDGFGGAI